MSFFGAKELFVKVDRSESVGNDQVGNKLICSNHRLLLLTIGISVDAEYLTSERPVPAIALPGKAIHEITRSRKQLCLCDLRVIRGSFLLQRKKARNEIRTPPPMKNC
jgi:hypothetical protein